MSLSSVRSFDRLIRHAFCGPVLALLMVLAQFGAVRHEISHLVDEQGQVQSHGKQLAHAGTCEECLAYAQVASPLASGQPTAFTIPLAHVMSGQVRTEGIAQDAPTARGRGPPLDL